MEDSAENDGTSKERRKEKIRDRKKVRWEVGDSKGK